MSLGIDGRVQGVDFGGEISRLAEYRAMPTTVAGFIAEVTILREALSPSFTDAKLHISRGRFIKMQE